MQYEFEKDSSQFAIQDEMEKNMGKHHSDKMVPKCLFIFVGLAVINVATVLLCFWTISLQSKEIATFREEIDSLNKSLQIVRQQQNFTSAKPLGGGRDADHVREIRSILKKGVIAPDSSSGNDLKLLLYRLQLLLDLFANGKTGTTTACPTSVLCREGKRGPRGKAGPMGPKGDQGERGSTGSRGSKGERGKRGTVGPRGQPGLSVEKPRITLRPQNVTVLKGSVATFKCDAMGYPQPEIQWYHNKVLISKDERKHFNNDGKTLEIKMVSETDEGKIECVAVNILGKSTSNGHLVVDVPPIVSVKNKGIFAYEGQPFRQICESVGNPKPSVFWRRQDGKTLPPGDTLTLDKVTTADSGTYECIAQNRVGTSRTTVFLFVVGIKSDCRDVLQSVPLSKDGVYRLKSGNHWCQMSPLGACGGGGWTLALKADGSKMTFAASASYWTSSNVYKARDLVRSLSDVAEAKFPAFNSLAFGRICLGIKDGNRGYNYLSIPIAGQSLLSIFQSGKFVATNLGRRKWKNLIVGSSLQVNCNREGINVKDDYKGLIRARIGIVANNENECVSLDSAIGAGLHPFSYRCEALRPITGGNFAFCLPDNGVKALPNEISIYVQ